MPSVYQFSELEILSFFLVLIRLSAFIISWPVFGVPQVPGPLKVLLSLALALLVFPLVDTSTLISGPALDSLSIVWLVVREGFIGLSFGFLARFFFYAIGIAGEIISVSMGISTAQLFDPNMDERSAALNQVMTGFAALFFLAINGHHLMISGIVDSFRIVPLSESLLSVFAFGQMGSLVQEVAVFGVKMCAPVMIAILFMNISMAVVGRAVPQINVLITSLPVNILVGFLALLISFPLIVWQMHDILEVTMTRVFQVLKSY